ncbi:MAG: hypothetical protein D6785_01070, partial [Planctomycetota bacterium]
METYFIELFPLAEETIPPLYAYALIGSKEEIDQIQGKFFFHLKKEIPGYWVFLKDKIISHRKLEEGEKNRFLESLWTRFPSIFGGVRDFAPITDWIPTSWEKGEFVRQAIIQPAQKEIFQSFTKLERDFGRARVEFLLFSRSWLVEDRPAIFLDCSPRLISRENLNTLLKKEKNRDWRGKQVTLIGETFRGKILQ